MKSEFARQIPGFTKLPLDWQRAILALEREGLGTLTPNGFLTEKEANTKQWKTSESLQFSDYRFDYLGEVAWSINYLRTRTVRPSRKRAGTIYSYALKHCLERERETERLQGTRHTQTYICNGAAILAAKLSGLKIERSTLRSISPNATIYIGNVDPIDAGNWGDYIGCRARGAR